MGNISNLAGCDATWLETTSGKGKWRIGKEGYLCLGQFSTEVDDALMTGFYSVGS